MKFVGRILLLIAGILFLVSGVTTSISLIQNFPGADWQSILAYVIDWLMVAVMVFGGLGAIFFFFGIPVFRGWVGPIAIILFVLWVISVVSATIAVIGGANFWDSFKSVIFVGVPEALYVVGYFLAKKK